MKSMDSTDSDEEYVAEVDEQSDELDSLVADDSEQDDFFEEDEEEEVWCVIAKPRAQRLATRSRKNRVKREEDEEEEWRVIAKPRAQRLATRSRKNSVKREEDEEEEEKEDEEEEEEWRVIAKPRAQRLATRSRKNSVKREEDEEEEEKEDEEEEEEWRVIAKPRVQRLATRSRKNSIKRDDDEREEVDIVEEEWRSGLESRAQKGYRRSRTSKQKKVAEEDEEQGADGGGWITVVKPSVQMSSTRSRKNEAKPKKRRKVTSGDSGESDDDDEEFTPDDFDSLEEDEDVSFLSAKTKKRGRPTLKRISSMKSQRRKRSANAVRKPLQKKTKKTRSLKRKTKCGDDEDVSDKCPVLRTRCKKRPVHRNKRVVDGSDSDFLSDSSDYDFTISEEEQVSNVDEISRSLKTNLRSSRKIQEDEALCKLRKPLIRKGKEKAEETNNDVGKSVCGICFTEEGKSIVRGTLSCCNHYFCFACIMEWSNVESRCPVCKQRFVTISKPARNVKGFDLRNVVIQVPERDQVYQPSEEELREFLNPYDNVICTECHLGGDDALMLLCDLCDSPAHTYCVGLGREVPADNWYCDGCRAFDLGSSHSQSQVLAPDRIASADASDSPPAYENMADIDLNVTIPETPLSQGNGFLSSSRFSGGSLQASSPVSGMGVSTVFGRRRRLRSRIWNMLSDRLAPRADLSSPHTSLSEVNSTFQPIQTTGLGISHYAQRVDRLHELAIQNLQNEYFFPRRMAHMDGQIVQSSTATNGLDQSHMQLSGMPSINFGAIQTQTSNVEQLRPCSSRSSMGPNLRTYPSHDRSEDHANIARQQVHSMVRSELKILSQDMNLGHDAYADISRKSTDTVMAACGLELRRNNVYEARLPDCLHAEKLDDIESCPTSSCCLTCFENFVKDVVRRIMDITRGPHWLLGH